MKSWFARRGRADLVPLDDVLPGRADPVIVADRACCCLAQPVVTVVIPAARGCLHPVDLLLCGHHYRVGRTALHAIGADVYDRNGALIMTGAGERSPASRRPAGAAA